MREKFNGLNLMSQYRPCIPDKWHVVVKLFHNFEARMWKYDHMTMNSPHLTLVAKLTQRLCNVVIQTKRRRCDFDVGFTRLSLKLCVDFTIKKFI